MVAVPPGQVVLSVYGWISMFLYLYLICKLLQWRRNVDQFKSSYYLLFLMQAAADFYMFIFIEIIMRPRKFNYFGLFSENMRGYAVFTTANILIAKAVLCCGHVLIALNRFTAFYIPFKQEKIWKRSVTIASILSLWGLCISISLPAIIIYRNAPKLNLLAGGILHMHFGAIHEYNSYQTRVVYIFTVVSCSTLYLCSYLKARKSKVRNAKVEQRVLLCAAASSFPFCIEMARITLEYLSSEQKSDVFVFVAEFWFYEMEMTVTASVWMQLLINKNVRHLILKDLLGEKDIGGTSVTKTKISTF